MPPCPARHRLAGLALLLLPVWCWATTTETPLTLPGTRVLFQRVLTKPGAAASEAPGQTGTRLISALSRLYVYERRTSADQEWLRLGTDTVGRNLLGWVPAGLTLAWNQQLTLALTNPAGRERLIFFRDLDSLRAVLDAPSPATAARTLLQGIEAGDHDPRVVALEPETYVNLYDRFYLLPILDVKDYGKSAGNTVHSLKVASVTLPAAPGPVSRPPAPPTPPTNPLKDYKAAIVFVIDSTVSMGPYIAETRAAVKQFYERIRRAGLLDKVAFGLVAFRAETGSPETNRRLEYVAKVFAAPTQVSNGDAFLVDRLRKKVSLYSLYYGDIFGWVDIAQADNPRNREAVYPIPLKDLP
ncbi:hypothetical protein [uncultured Thiodictyon sp.]|uniref:hypothetical protein n=1 Tax=uncultured Thiodictyon sp. TaxID=1846217 RepID=UPI0025EFF7FA|nr:hypothetical protein [uncultured Thiodictyon sp.]